MSEEIDPKRPYPSILRPTWVYGTTLLVLDEDAARHKHKGVVVPHQHPIRNRQNEQVLITLQFPDGTYGLYSIYQLSLWNEAFPS